MADRDDAAMDVGAIEDDALNDEDEENEEEVEEGYKITKVSGCVEINQCASGPPDNSSLTFLGDDAAVLARSSGEETALPRHRAGVASMAWRTTR